MIENRLVSSNLGYIYANQWSQHSHHLINGPLSLTVNKKPLRGRPCVMYVLRGWSQDPLRFSYLRNVKEKCRGGMGGGQIWPINEFNIKCVQ